VCVIAFGVQHVEKLVKDKMHAQSLVNAATSHAHCDHSLSQLSAEKAETKRLAARVAELEERLVCDGTEGRGGGYGEMLCIHTLLAGKVDAQHWHCFVTYALSCAVSCWCDLRMHACAV
jgi:hypothetical protein